MGLRKGGGGLKNIGDRVEWDFGRQLCKGLENFWRFSLKVGKGDRIKFWKDVWCGSTSLMEEFPQLYGLAVNKEAWVGDYIEDGEGGFHWNITFCRKLNDWEVENALIFFHTLYKYKISLLENDNLLWHHDPKGLLSVKSYYFFLSSNGEVFHPADRIWISSIPPKVAFFTWLVACGKCLKVLLLISRLA